jgi:hypothetical protein
VARTEIRTCVRLLALFKAAGSPRTSVLHFSCIPCVQSEVLLLDPQQRSLPWIPQCYFDWVLRAVLFPSSSVTLSSIEQRIVNQIVSSPTKVVFHIVCVLVVVGNTRFDKG